MAKHEVIIRENTGTTKESAPYLPSYVKKTDLPFAQLCTLVAAESGLTDTQVRAIFEGAFGEFETLEKDAAVRIHVDGLTVCLAIYGSFASSDAAFDPLVNTLEMSIRLDDDITNALVNVTPTIVTDETTTKVRITGIADCEEERPYGVLYGLRTFAYQGLNVVSGDAGGEVYLENGLGAKFPCGTVGAGTKQLGKAYSKTLLEGGDYKFVLKTRGGDPEGPLQTVTRNVKYVKAVPVVTGVELTEWTVEDGGDLNKVLGRYLPTANYNAEGNKLTVTFTKPGASEPTVVTVDPVAASSTSEKLAIQPVKVYEAMSGMETGDSVEATIEVKYGTTSAGQAALTLIKG